MFNKLFNLTQNFNIKYDLARSVKLNFSSNTRSIIDEPEGKIDTQAERDALRDSILTFGRPTMYHHQYDVRYTVPINKFPLTDWVSLTLNYSGTYDWNAGSMALVNDSINLGNVIQNTNKKRINAQLNMNTLYNKVPFIKSLNAVLETVEVVLKIARSDSRSVSKDSRSKNKSSEKEDSDEEDEEEKKKNTLDHIVNVFSHFARMAFSVKNVNMSYDETNGSMLPGLNLLQSFLVWHKDLVRILHQDGDIFWENNRRIRSKSFCFKWLDYFRHTLEQPFTQQYTSRLNIRSTVEPIKKLRIQITAQRSETINTSSLFKNSGGTDIPIFELLNENRREVLTCLSCYTNCI